MMRPPEERLQDLPPVRRGLKEQFESKARMWERQKKFKNRWSSKLQRRFTEKARQEFQQRLQKSGSIQNLKDSCKPVAQGPKALKQAKHRAWKLSSRAARKQGEDQAMRVTFEPLPEDMFLGQQVRIISPATHPNYLGKVAKVTLVQLRRMRPSDPGTVLLQLEFSALGQSSALHIPKVEVQLCSHDDQHKAPVPFRLNYQSFSN